MSLCTVCSSKLSTYVSFLIKRRSACLHRENNNTAYYTALYKPYLMICFCFTSGNIDHSFVTVLSFAHSSNAAPTASLFSAHHRVAIGVRDHVSLNDLTACKTGAFQAPAQRRKEGKAGPKDRRWSVSPSLSEACTCPTRRLRCTAPSPCTAGCTSR
jgi:hypothetical protein